MAVRICSGSTRQRQSDMAQIDAHLLAFGAHALQHNVARHCWMNPYICIVCTMQISVPVRGAAGLLSSTCLKYAIVAEVASVVLV